MNSNTIINGLRGIGPLTLKNASAFTLFQYAPSAAQANDNPGTLLPVVLNVPSQESLDYSALGSSGAGTAANAGSLSGVPLPSGELWTADGKPFSVRAVGTVQPLQASKTLTLGIFLGNGLTGGGAPNDVSLANVTQVLGAANPFASNWLLQLDCLWDRTSTRLNTVLSGQINGVAVAAQAYSIGIAEGLLNFCVGASLSDSGAGQTATFNITLTEFAADLR